MPFRPDRRAVLAGVTALAAGPAWARPAGNSLHLPPRMRVIVDNDFGGDPDGLFQLAHFALSPSMALPLVIGSQFKDFGEADREPHKARLSARKAAEVLAHVPPRRSAPIIAGSDRPLLSRSDGLDSPATAAICREALRGDTDLPLFHAAGGSLTEIARAWLAEPRIGKRLRLVWIGGAEHHGLAGPPPGPVEAEYNFSLDRLAAQVIFNESDIEIWQVPRNAFRQVLVSLAELAELEVAGPLGRYLHREVVAAHQRLAGNLPRFIFSPGETITLGDTALVTLTALQSAFQPDSASSSYASCPTPLLSEDGGYRPNPSGRPMRVYNTIDAGLTWRDLLAKLRQNGAHTGG